MLVAESISSPEDTKSNQCITTVPEYVPMQIYDKPWIKTNRNIKMFKQVRCVDHSPIEQITPRPIINKSKDFKVKQEYNFVFSSIRPIKQKSIIKKSPGVKVEQQYQFAHRPPLRVQNLTCINTKIGVKCVPIQDISKRDFLCR